MSVSESFFIDRIKYGLGLISETLTESEEVLLNSNIHDLGESGFTPEEAQKLQEKCSKALSKAYRENTGNRKSNDGELKRIATIYMNEWRENNSRIYLESESILSGVVQNWYLGEGRSLEKKAVGCLPVFAFFMVISSLIWWVISFN